jgi:hypothetical protein
MSRYSFQKQMEGSVVTIAYGYDHAMGYFYQEEGEGGELIADLDSLFGGLTGVQLAERLCGDENALIACLEAEAKYPPGVNPQHVNAMMLDLTF